MVLVHGMIVCSHLCLDHILFHLHHRKVLFQGRVRGVGMKLVIGPAARVLLPQHHQGDAVTVGTL